MKINPKITELIDETTELLTGWDEVRGNYKEKYCDKHKLVNLVISRCVEFIEQDQGSGKLLADRLKKHFGVEDDLGNS